MLGFGALGEYALGEGPNGTVTTFTPAPRATWHSPLRKAGLTAAVVATTFVGFVPPPQAQAARVFTQFSQPVSKSKIVQQAWLSTPFFKAPQTAVFAEFSQPQIPRVNLPDEQPSTLFEVRPPPVISIAFTKFSQPSFNKTTLPDEQPSTLFEVLPPQAPPFTGFARFVDYLPKKSVVFLYSSFPTGPVFIPFVDTHDGVWVKKKRKKLDRDPLDLELEERAKRRAAIELAVYGAEVTYEPPAPALFAPTVQPPPNVEELARAIMAAKQMHEQQQRAALEQDDEDVLEMILRDL